MYRFSARSGITLLLTLLVMGAVVFFGVLYLESTQAMKHQSRYAALGQLATDRSWTAGFTDASLPSQARYSLSLVNNMQAVAATTGFDGRVLPPQTAHLRSDGAYGLATRHVEAIVSIADNGEATLLKPGGK